MSILRLATCHPARLSGPQSFTFPLSHLQIRSTIPVISPFRHLTSHHDSFCHLSRHLSHTTSIVSTSSTDSPSPHPIPIPGEATPPRFGDYEAQRHWMEITLHTPVREWYTETPANPLQYWGLDYPPLTAYQSLAHGWAMHLLDPDSVALETSRGHETTKR